MMRKSKVAVILMATLLLGGCAKPVQEKTSDNKPQTSTPKPEMENAPPMKEFVKKEFFTPIELSAAMLTQMEGVSYPNDADPNVLSLNDLRAINIRYYGFDDKTHEDGVLIVNRDVAEEVCDIFEELYEKKYPIQRINMIDDYDANDDKSMEANNTSAFCYRAIAGTDVLSNHSFGRAIDINPLQNPQVTSKGDVLPEEGRAYIDRSKKHKGMIMKGDDCYIAFTSRGWTWGGDWDSTKDYQHFEKN